ncbi:DUF1284 domain-containing protein [Ensifer soli]|uniref:DUF1284 domain-containing protein n=1 Tax=Ciceribacter sp. sgz301302 TaxID=3342379 RepID=UPI0035BAC14C
MTVRLRPHHLLCLLTYVGRGYGAAFVDNYDRIATRLSAGEDVLIVDGPDDICAPLLSDADAHCHGAGVLGRDRQAARDTGRILRRAIRPGTRLVLPPDRVGRLRAAFAGGASRAACAGCEWSGLCDAIAAGGFRGARLFPPEEGAAEAGDAPAGR